MIVKSLGLRTNFIFARYSGKVLDRENYTLVQTPSNPGFHWGNFIIFDHAPQKGDYLKWKQIFDREFSYYKEPHHYVFTWDTDKAETGEIEEFLAEGFELDSGVVLTAQTLKQPLYYNKKLAIKKIDVGDNQAWESITELQTLCADPKYINNYYIDFKRAQMKNYRAMSESNLGCWFGAYVDDVLVGDLGIYCEEDIARYQNVGTHPNFRKQGICQTLVYEAGQIALREFGIKTLVMEADPDYHAARIYESVGFSKKEQNYALSWWQGAKL